MKAYQANKVSEAVLEVIHKEFHNYIEDRKNSDFIKNEVTKVRLDLEAIIDQLNNDLLFENVNSITIKLHNRYIEFFYSKDTNEWGLHRYKVSNDAYELELAKNIIYEKYHLTESWLINKTINSRVNAILVLLDESAFDDVLTIVESQIDFDELIDLAYNDNTNLDSPSSTL